MMRTALPPRVEVVPSMDEYCDRCTASAKLSLVLHAGGDLAFCGHHANRHVDDILAQAARVSVEDGFSWRGMDTTGD